MELKIGGTVNAPKKTVNLYKLIVDHQFGDADGEKQITTLWSKSEEKGLKEYLEMINGISSDKGYPDDEITSKIDELGTEYKKEDLIIMDPLTDYNEAAIPCFEKLTWFDENGIEHKVTIE